MGKRRLEFCTGPSCRPRLPEETLTQLEALATQRGYEVRHCDCLGACPVGPNALSDTGDQTSPRQRTLLTGLESLADLEKVLSQLEAALTIGECPRTIVGKAPSFQVKVSTGTPA